MLHNLEAAMAWWSGAGEEEKGNERDGGRRLFYTCHAEMSHLQIGFSVPLKMISLLCFSLKSWLSALPYTNPSPMHTWTLAISSLWMLSTNPIFSPALQDLSQMSLLSASSTPTILEDLSTLSSAFSWHFAFTFILAFVHLNFNFFFWEEAVHEIICM